LAKFHNLAKQKRKVQKNTKGCFWGKKNEAKLSLHLGGGGGGKKKKFAKFK
jgi:hypothetical protein